MHKAEDILRKTLKDMFAENAIDLAVGFREGSIPGSSRPCFIGAPDGTDTLVWNSFCSNNIAAFLPGILREYRNAKKPLPRIAVAAKGCDARSIVGLVKENQVPAGNLILVGMPCGGMVDRKKLEKLSGKDELLSCLDAEDGRLELHSAGGRTKKVAIESVVCDACLGCAYPTSDIVDIKIEGKSRAAADAHGNVKDFSIKTPEERWRHFRSEVSRCIRCYACRQACPSCYCVTCFADQEKPRWIGAGDELSDVMMFHIGRMFHQAGRCVDCGACARACPMGIDLTVFTGKLGMDVEDLFAYVPGLAKDAPPPLCTYKEDDDQEFITDPEGE